jgi:hypothetical protein
MIFDFAPAEHSRALLVLDVCARLMREVQT